MGNQINKSTLVDKSTLKYLGNDFQYKLVKAFVEDNKFFENTASIIDQNAFTEPLLKTFVGVIKDYYSKNSIVPSYETIGILLNSMAKTTIEADESDALIKKIKFDTKGEGCATVKDLAVKFFKQQNYIKIANKILEIAATGDVDRCDECQKLFDEAAMAGQDDDFGFTIYEKEQEALSKDYTVSIPTGIDKLDEVLGGGLDKGKLGLLIAPAGFGKTSFTTAIDAYAASYRCPVNNNEGFKVLQIYFEDDDVDITRKHFARETDVEARNMKRLNPTEREEIELMLESSPNKELLGKNLRLKHFKTGTKSATDIEIFVKRLINYGFKPDMISIDYFECLAPEKGGYSSDTEWTREGVTMRKLENMAHDLNCAIWIPTQGTKDSMNSPEVVRMDQASGSAKKIHVAQLILSIARALGDIEKNRAVISILKNRSGKSGKIFKNVIFNNGTCKISCDEMEVYDDDLAFVDKENELVEENRINTLRKISQAQRQIDMQVANSNVHEVRDRGHGNLVGTMGPSTEF